MAWRWVAVSFFCVLHVGAQPPSELDDRISSALKASGAPSVSVAVIQNNRVIYSKAFGSAAANRAAQPDTRYAVGSISKQFTAAALLLLQEQKKLSLDDKVSKYFPDLTRAGEVTIRQLLSHTSGYEDYAPQDYIIPEWEQPTTPLAILDRWAKKPLNFDPGTRWQYSNTNYVLAGEIFEKVSGRPLVEFLREKFFIPLGMTTAGDCLPAGPADAAAYTRYALGPARPVGREGSGWYFGAGELCMTASDLARWDIAFLQNRMLSAASYEEFTREIKLKDGKETHYALGLDVTELSGIREISHGGEVSGFLAINRLFPAKQAAVVMFSNEDGINLIGPLSEQIALDTIEPQGEIQKVRGILEGLQLGRIDRSQFTGNANSYFTDTALGDYRTSLAALGKLQSVTRQREQLRGGMTHRLYRARFETKTVVLNVYTMPDGRFEQFLVEEQI